MFQISSERILEESGISVAPPQRQQTASSISAPFSVPSTHSQCVEPTTLSRATAPDDIDNSSSEDEMKKRVKIVMVRIKVIWEM